MPRTAHRQPRIPYVIAVTAALVGAVLLTGCGAERRDITAPPRDGKAAATTPTPTPSAAGPSPYVEPGAGDGAPHYRENNAHRLPGEMSAASERAAEAQAKRVERVLKRLWAKRTWDPDSVRAALRADLGTDTATKLTVQSMYARWDSDKNKNVTPEGAMIGLRVRDDACVTAFIQKSNYEAKTNGPFMETGCMEPPVGH
ncbi:hypothetical protein ABT390_36920 [Streptomyces aurantiacus]|uniref:Lipoprotein n=1 Tax=Streptomyces aurantiacus JA 4570 TaxID=1286094 RepID=S4A018_9ACTN|nr:hypothetical protein [Streptomyces aurantiacus]EPH44030.1 hypothetical protein STRAU_2893 [Streptomyces aurantiacus JA 4570]